LRCCQEPSAVRPAPRSGVVRRSTLADAGRSRLESRTLPPGHERRMQKQPSIEWRTGSADEPSRAGFERCLVQIGAWRSVDLPVNGTGTGRWSVVS